MEDGKMKMDIMVSLNKKKIKNKKSPEGCMPSLVYVLWGWVGGCSGGRGGGLTYRQVNHN